MEGLHPRLASLLRAQGWTGLTEAQQAAQGPLGKGEHVLLVAPTGHGKTEAALLPVLSRLLAERDALEKKGKPWPRGFKALYVTPLRALNRDLHGRLVGWCAELGLRLGVRHGDTTTAERSRQARDPPDLLLTTPETVQLLLYGDTLRRHLGTVRFVVLDEIHDLAASERGAQLAVALERIEEAIAQPAALREAKAPERPCPAAPSARPDGQFQRIGLSATIADPGQVAAFLGGPGRAVRTVQVAARKELRLSVQTPKPAKDDDVTATRLSLTPPIVAQVRAVRALVAAHERVLVFQNTRDGAELLVSRSAILDAEGDGPPARLALHHGSLSAEHRMDVEDAFKRGEVKALVATSSLELGIDVGAIDHVVQVQSPRSVARLVQRLGRSGHTVTGVASGTLLATGPEDILECAAVALRAKAGRLEPLAIRELPLVVLANQLVALANEYQGLRKEWARAVVARAAPFRDLDDALFDAVWSCLLEVKTLFLEEKKADRIARGGRARRHFLDHISLIPDETTYRVVDEATKRAIGTVDDAFVAAAMAPGALVVMAGRSWRVLEVEPEAHRVRVAPVPELGPVPQWSGAQLPVSFEVAQEVAVLRRQVADGEVGALAGLLGEVALEEAARPILAHKAKGLAVPSDRVVTIEVAQRVAVVGVSLGTRGNEALGRITQALLAQKLGGHVGMESDAYRIHLALPATVPATVVQEVWASLEPRGLDILLSIVLRESPVLRHHLVHVAKHFGALPKELDPNTTTRGKLDALLGHLALQEETLSRLIHDRMDVAAVAKLLGDLAAGRTTVVVQGTGPLTHLGREESMRLMLPARSDDALLAAVRKRIEESDALLACCACATSWQSAVHLLPKAIRCRRCGSNQVACLRPWHLDQVPLLRSKAALDPGQAAERARMQRNGALVASFGPVACRALVARGVGPDTAVRILQKVADPANPAFWREILQAELTFARTNAYWRA
ncbi:MAG: ATP-dependent helicase Lhr and Lhr-like helicase [Thermoplasmata archaeon]|jgi:ATP-dependent Lhr-like helicase|nr:ATP-dependent helicase Lhr and Lhr-like helicase [Thermoplasmata archaeon]